MKLTAEQLTEIKAFIKKKGYPEPDIQMELLDHLACGIEERMEAGVPFEKAFRDTYSSFGIFGFTDFVDGITKGHERTVWFQIKSYLKTIFGFPWVIFTLLLVYALYTATVRYSFWVPVSVLGISTVLSYFIYFKYYFKKERKYKNLGIVKNSNAFMGGATGGIIASFQIWNYLKITSSPEVIAVLSILWIGIYYFTLLGAWTMKNHALNRAEELENLYGNLDKI
jgi:hypothetical protein